METISAWLKPPHEAGGQDHIGVQQPPTRIFTTLLPGLTVVTDRVANYSFYAWLSWAYVERRSDTALDFIHTLRRGECLLTLISERHAAQKQEPVFRHSLGLVGRNSLIPLQRPGTPRPVSFATLAALRDENEKSYFKNRYGGLGQYYLGSLRELGILDRDDDEIACSEDVGVPLAKAFDARVDRATFFDVLERGVVTDGELDALASFCPCHLAANEAERTLLVDLLFARRPDASEGDLLRRQTLLLLLDFAARRGPMGEIPLDFAFKAACLTGAMDDGAQWSPPAAWDRVRRAWGTYEINDELSIAALGVFWVALSILDERGGLAAGSHEVGGWVATFAREVLGDIAGMGLKDAIDARAGSLPALGAWTNEAHEFPRSDDVQSEARAGERAGCLSASTDVLLAIAARHLKADPYVDVGISTDYLRDYPLNLAAYARSVRDEWAGLTVAEWLGRFAVSWGIEAHLRVALKKLHHESKDKFLVRVTDDGLRRRDDDKGPPLPGFTASRVNRAVRFLVDLGLFSLEGAAPASVDDEEDEEEAVAGISARITPYGRSILEEFRG